MNSKTAWIGLLLVIMTGAASANDWPMWRYDTGRSAAAPHALADDLNLQWTREYPQLEPVWDDPLNRDLMQYDTVYEPIIADDVMYLASNAFDRVTALDLVSGDELWSFYANGPVRFSPVVYEDKLILVSDDGFMYCLDRKSGDLIWKYRAVDNDRKVLGNERIVSTWVSRGGPAVENGVVYGANGIWPMMGVFIYALDVETGEEIWVNDSESADFRNQPHGGAYSFASIAPQGVFVLNKDRLLTPGGRSVPAAFDKNTGEFLYYMLYESGKSGGAFTIARGDQFIGYHRDSVVSMYDAASGERIVSQFAKMPVWTDDFIFGRGERVEAFDYANFDKIEYEKKVIDKDTKEVKVETEVKWMLEKLWEIEADATGDLILAGNTLYAGGDKRVTAIDVSQPDSPQVAWTKPVDGLVKRLVAANGKLIAVTLEGGIYVFGEEAAQPKRFAWNPAGSSLGDDALQRAQGLLDAVDIRDGYALAFGVSDGDLIEALVRKSDLYITAVSSDTTELKPLRDRFVSMGLYGKRVSIQPGDPKSFEAPAYVASLIVVEKMSDALSGAEQLQAIFNSLRPYGGTACFSVDGDDSIALIKTIDALDLPNAKLYENDGWLMLSREGALPGSDDWTHNYGDIANTLKSDDELVKLPLGMLWFGGSSNMDVLPRHGHGPPQQVVDGRLFIQGIDVLSARDVYTGRVLWKRELPNLGNYGVYYDDTYADTPLDTAYNQIHIPGANARGTNYVVASDTVYIIEDGKCLMLDSATGQTKGEIELPLVPGDDERPDWGYIGVYEDTLIAGSGFVSYLNFVKLGEELADKRKPWVNFDITSSKRLVVMDRHSGEVKWTFTSELGLRHNAIIAGDGKLFCIDKMPDPVSDALKRRGSNFFGTPRLLAFDIESGDIVWSKSKDIFGTWLGYSQEHDILLEAGRPSRDMLIGEPEGLTAYRGNDGELLWSNPEAEYGGPCILHGETIINDPWAFSLLTGEQLTRKHPITGEETPWQYKRAYGCNYAVASENMLTFRSGAAGFFDLSRDSGVGNFGGFKSGCTNTLIAANGLLNAPDYTRTCSCSYQNQTSLALIHDPEVELWTYNFFDLDGEPVRQLGLNLGAPGDRRADNGVLWLEYPVEGGPSPELAVETEPAELNWFRNHTYRMNGGDLKWVSASGAEGLRKVTVKLSDSAMADARYSVRLFFMEPESLRPGERVFDVAIQGETLLSNFDIIAEAGAVRNELVKEFNDIPVRQELVIELTPAAGEPILCGIEIVDKASVATIN